MGARLSIRTAMVALLVGQTLVVGALVGAVSLRYGNRSVDEMALQLAEGVGQRIEAHVARVLEVPPLLNELNADAIAAADLDPMGPTEPLELLFFRHLDRYRVSLDYLGTERGDYIGARRVSETERTISLVNEGTGFLNQRYAANAEGERTELLLTSEKVYDPRARPWYAPAVERDGPAWTDIYADYTSGALGITASRPLKREGELVGVLATDLLLDDLGRFLRELRIGKTGLTFLVEDSGLLVSTSTSAPIFEGPKGDITRLAAVDSADPRIAAAARVLTEGSGLGTEVATRAWLGDAEHYVVASPYADPLGLEWVVVVVVPRSDFTAHIDANLRWSILVSLLATLLAALVGAVFASRLAHALERVSREMGEVGQLHLEGSRTHSSRLAELEVIEDSLDGMKKGLRSFSRYVPVGLVRELLAQRREAVLGGEPRELTVVFSDIAGFTTLVESNEPDVVIDALGEYLDLMNAAIRGHDGVVCQYLGDGILALWGAPVEHEDHAARAMRGALAMRRAVRALAQRSAAAGRPVLPTRIGVNSGDVVVGNIGARERFNYGAIGDAVNTASRIEGLNKVYGTDLLVGERTVELAGPGFVTRPVDVVRVKGKQLPVRVYELLGEEGDASSEVREMADRHTRAFAAYLARDFEAALAELVGDLDPVSAELAERCRALREHPPPADWDGTRIMTTK